MERPVATTFEAQHAAADEYFLTNLAAAFSDAGSAATSPRDGVLSSNAHTADTIDAPASASSPYPSLVPRSAMSDTRVPLVRFCVDSPAQYILSSEGLTKKKYESELHMSSRVSAESDRSGYETGTSFRACAEMEGPPAPPIIYRSGGLPHCGATRSSGLVRDQSGMKRSTRTRVACASAMTAGASAAAAVLQVARNRRIKTKAVVRSKLSGRVPLARSASLLKEMHGSSASGLLSVPVSTISADAFGMPSASDLADELSRLRNPFPRVPVFRGSPPWLTKFHPTLVRPPRVKGGGSSLCPL